MSVREADYRAAEEASRRRARTSVRSFLNGGAERAVKSVRLELLNHVRMRDLEELQ